MESAIRLSAAPVFSAPVSNPVRAVTAWAQASVNFEKSALNTPCKGIRLLVGLVGDLLGQHLQQDLVIVLTQVSDPLDTPAAAEGDGKIAADVFSPPWPFFLA